MKIGILALQGGYAAHAKMLSGMGIDNCYIRQPAELAQVQGLILPGGESSTTLKLLHESGLFNAIKTAAEHHVPLFGTCAGAILMAKHVTTPTQASLGLVDVTVARNAYGRQLASRITYGRCKLKENLLEMVFIRAPRITDMASNVEVIAQYDNQPVCVQQNNYLLSTFHPELTCDTTLHHHFVNMVLAQTKKHQNHFHLDNCAPDRKN